MFYNDGDRLWKYTLKTEPPEAAHWSTYKLKLSHIKILEKVDRATAARLRAEILEDISKGENNER